MANEERVSLISGGDDEEGVSVATDGGSEREVSGPMVMSELEKISRRDSGSMYSRRSKTRSFPVSLLHDDIAYKHNIKSTEFY